MGLFSKKSCERCGVEARLMSEFKSGEKNVCLCGKCKEALHVEGYIDYSYTVLRHPPSYEELMEYSSYYDSVMMEAKAFRDSHFSAELIGEEDAEIIQQLFSYVLNYEKLNGTIFSGSYRYNALFLTSHQYKDLVIRRKDVYLVATSADLKGTKRLTDKKTSLITGMLFTHCPVIPYLPVLLVTGSHIFDLMKTKAQKEVMMALKVFYPGVQIEDAKVVRKQIKAGEFIPGIDSRLMCDVLSNVELNRSYCKGETLINEHVRHKRYASRLNLDLGFYVPKDEI